MKTISRRNALIAGFSSLITIGMTSAHAAPASVPVIWDGKKMFESFEKEGTGISSKGPAGRPKAYVAFDTQCRDCWQLHRKLEPFLDKIEFVFCPISFMNIHSEPQATTILIDKDPLAKLEEHFAHFTDVEFRGIRYGSVENYPWKFAIKFGRILSFIVEPVAGLFPMEYSRIQKANMCHLMND